MKNGFPVVPKSNGSNTEKINKTDSSETDLIYPAELQEEKQYRSYFREKLELSILEQNYPMDKAVLHEILELLVETVTSRKKFLRICGEEKSKEVVKSRLTKLDSSHIQYILECLKENSTQILHMDLHLQIVLQKSWIIYYSVGKIMSRLCDGIITINHEDFENAKTMHCKNVYIIPSVGLDNARFRNIQIDRDTYRKSIGVDKNKIMILTVGELSERKNQQIIIKAIGKLEHKEKYVLVICGHAIVNSSVNSSIESDLKNLAKELCVEIRMLGHRLDIEVFNDKRVKIRFTFEDVLAGYAE